MLEFLKTWNNLLSVTPNVRYCCEHCPAEGYSCRAQLLTHQYRAHKAQVFDSQIEMLPPDPKANQVNLIQGYHLFQRYKELEEDLICKVCPYFRGEDDGSDLVGHYISNHLLIVESGLLQFL